MQPMNTIRQWQIDQMKKAVNTIGRLVETCSHTEATTIRDGGDGWTVLEVMGHLRDFEAVFLERARLTATQEMPELPFPDPVSLAIENDYNGGDLHETYVSWAGIRNEHVAFLETLAESDWERPAKHPTRGAFTLTDQLLLTVWHDMNHIEQIAHIHKA
jgi:hypothetical protein